jgi:putative ABC transport system permease protein
VTIQQLAADLTALETSFSKGYPEPVQFVIVARSLQEAMAQEVRLPLLILMAAVVAVLFIVCINLMNLMMVRSIAQRGAWAIRLAMGAKVRDLLWGAFIESLLLSLAGATAGSLLAWSLLRLVTLKAPIDLPRIDELSLDPAALLFALSASVATAILFGIWPAWRASRVNPQEALQSSGRAASESRKGRHSGKILVTAEVTLSTVLLLSAGLLLRSFVNILSVNPGLNIQHLLTVRINLPPEKYHRDSDVSSFYRRLLDGIKGLPGVEGTGLVSDLPLTRENNNNPATAADRPMPPVTQWPMTNWRYASSEYFKTAGIPFRDGRSFVEREGDTREVVISENLAARLWQGQTAVGRPLKIYGNPRVQTVVGAVGAIHATSLMDDPTMMIYFPNLNHFARDMALFVRSERDPQDLASAVRTIVAGLDSQAAIPSIETMNQVAARSLAPRRFQLVLMISFAVVAFLLACMGIYGVLAFTTSRRTSEIGIRMALGARPAQILESIVLNGMVPVLIGIVAGLCVSVALSRVLQALLFQMQALNLAIYLTVSIVMAAVAALACYMPARRAASLNPLEALRDG